MPKLRVLVIGDEYINVDVPDEAFITLTKNPNLTFDVSGASKEAGAAAILWNLHRGANQRWKIQAVTGSRFRIVSAHSGLCLTLGGDGMGPVTQAPAKDDDYTQLWWLRSVDGGFEIANGEYISRIAAETATAGKPLKGFHANDGSRIWTFTAA
ncbi:RICIN domain-containing protein [Streptomyces olivoreticuli]